MHVSLGALHCLYLLIGGEGDYFWFGQSIIEPFTD